MAGLLARKDAPYRYSWDRSLFLIYRRKELQGIMEKLGFSQQVGLVAGPRPQPPRVTAVFGQLICPLLVSLRISTAWRWWAKGSLSPR